MRIFVAYGYNPRDNWIEPVTTPLIQAFDSEPIDGRELQGQVITQGVRQTIRDCDGLVAFFTRRGEPIAPQTWNSHQWVRDELTVALENNKRVLEIYEEGVPREAGLAGRDRQYVTYREAQPVDCVVEIVKVLGRWHLRGTRRFQLLPNSMIRPHLSKQYFRCRYNVMEGNNVTTTENVPVQRIQGGLFINVEGLSRDCMIQVEVVTDTGVLSSDYTSIDAISIQVE